jgi:hypothetical protein
MLVLPRFWPADLSKPQAWFKDNGRTLSVIAHEGDEVVLNIEEQWRPLIEKACTLAAQVVAADDESGDDAWLGSENAQQSPADGSGSRQVRLSLCGPLLSSTKKASSVEAIGENDPFDERMGHFVSLLERAQGRVLPTPLNDGLPSPAVAAGGEGASLLRLMLAHNGLTAIIRNNLHRIRRGYVEWTDAEPKIRGRITQRGVATLVTRSSLRIECTFDEFSELTPLFRLLMTALDVVSHKQFELAEARIFPQQTAKDAARLRSQLLVIPSISIDEATSLAPRMRLRGRLRAEWQEALDLARLVLAPEQASQFAVNRLLHTGATLQVVSSTFWEQSVLSAAMGTKKDVVGNVWDKCGGPVAPDCVVRVPHAPDETIPAALETFFNEKLRNSSAEVSGADARSHVGVVIDAKYAIAHKNKSKGLSTPTSGYQYQMLAYSLLVENCVAAVLFHATDAGPSEKELRASKPFPRLVPKPPPDTGQQTDCILMVMEHPFPTVEDCRDNEKWRLYLQGVSKSVGDRLRAGYAAVLSGVPAV